MYAVEAKFSLTEFVDGRAKFLGLETVEVGDLVDRRLRRNKHTAVFSTRELAEKMMAICDPQTHTSSYRVRNRVFIAFDNVENRRRIW